MDLGPALASRGRVQEALRAIQKGLAALAEIPTIERRSLALEPRVLVVGAGRAGLEAAAALRALGHPVTIVEQADGTADRTAVAGATLLAGSKVRHVEGQVGGFAVTVRTPTGDRRVACGAVLLASGVGPRTRRRRGSLWHGRRAALGRAGGGRGPAAPPPRRALRGPGPGLAPGRNARLHREALELALRLQKESSHQVHLFCRDVRVAAMELEELYDRARQAGVDIVKFEGQRPCAPRERRWPSTSGTRSWGCR